MTLVSKNVTAFYSIKHMPIPMHLPFMEDCDKLKDILIANSAKWHKSCNMKFSSSRLKRVISKSQTDSEVDPPNKRTYTRSSNSDHVSPVTDIESTCFFCNCPELYNNKLHEVMCMKVDNRVRKAAQCLQDQELLAKLSTGDLIAIEAKYHPPCILDLYHRAERRIIDDGTDVHTHNEQTCKGIALAELKFYM